MENLIYTTEMELIERLAPIVAKDNKSIVFWTHKEIFQEKVFVEDQINSAKTAVFEAIRQGFEDEDDLVDKASKIYRSYYWGKGTVFYDRYRRNRTGKSRSKLFSGMVDTLPWGEELSGQVVNQPTEEIENEDMSVVFEHIEKEYGTEVALVFLLVNAYDVSLGTVISKLYGLDSDLDSEEYHKNYQRMYRLFPKIKEHLKGIL